MPQGQENSSTIRMILNDICEERDELHRSRENALPSGQKLNKVLVTSEGR